MLIKRIFLVVMPKACFGMTHAFFSSEGSQRPVTAWPIVCFLIYLLQTDGICDNSRQFNKEDHAVEELQDQKLEV